MMLLQIFLPCPLLQAAANTGVNILKKHYTTQEGPLFQTLNSVTDAHLPTIKSFFLNTSNTNTVILKVFFNNYSRLQAGNENMAMQLSKFSL